MSDMTGVLVTGVSYDLAHRLLGYSPTVRIEDGIPLLWQWFKAEVFRD